MNFKAAVGLACAYAHLFIKERLGCRFLFIANITSRNFGRHGKECWKERKEERAWRAGKKGRNVDKYAGPQNIAEQIVNQFFYLFPNTRDEIVNKKYIYTFDKNCISSTGNIKAPICTDSKSLLAHIFASSTLPLFNAS